MDCVFYMMCHKQIYLVSVYVYSLSTSACEGKGTLKKNRRVKVFWREEETKTSREQVEVKIGKCSNLNRLQSQRPKLLP